MMGKFSLIFQSFTHVILSIPQFKLLVFSVLPHIVMPLAIKFPVNCTICHDDL
jgi:hypothetical protein